MKFSLALAALAGTAVASNWFGTKPLYNKWHETELERWLSDNNVPYPTPADRKDLEDLVKTNWDANVVQPYNSWETPQLSKYIQAKGKEVKKGTEQNKDSLIAQAKSAWSETEQQATDAYESIKDWIFDTWSESQLKAFLDRHGIPNPQPRTRDSLLSSARENYQSVAEKASEYSHYPGAWLYQSWSDSDLKAWLDARGIPVPQPSNRDKLTAAVRRNSQVAAGNAAYYANAASASASSAGYGAASSASSAGYGAASAVSSAGSEAAASLSSAGSAATQAVADVLLDSWSESQIKEWCDKNGVKVPQGSKKNELLALARRKYAQLSGDNVSASAASAYGAATSKAGNQYAQATDMAGQQGQQFQQYAYEWFNWAKMQLGIASQSASSYVSASGYSAATAASASAFSAASMIKNSAYSAAYQAQTSAESAYSLASASASSAALSATDAAGSSASSAAVVASKSAYSASSLASKSYSSVSSSLSSAASSASVSASKAAAKSGPKFAKQAGDAAAESLSYGKHRVQEAYQKATDYVKEEL